jgi:N-acetylglucosamine malate deacetylase 1
MPAITPITRRRLLIQAGVATATATATAALPSLPAVAAVGDTPASPVLNVLVIGGHPGDPEAGCGGTIARYAGQGHKVTLLYLTRGEAGIPNKTAAEAAAIRTAEAQQACGILKATPAFAGQVDGATEITPRRYAEFNKLVADLNPDVVLTQWPVDTHGDHRACSMLTLDAFLAARRKFALYYYEVDLGSDTQCFRPTDYVDVTATERLKREACMAHQSQHPENFYVKDHEPMLRFRGMESGHKAAEGFIHHDQSPARRLPGAVVR